MKSAFLFSEKMQEVEMFIQTKCKERSFTRVNQGEKDEKKEDCRGGRNEKRS